MLLPHTDSLTTPVHRNDLMTTTEKSDAVATD